MAQEKKRMLQSEENRTTVLGSAVGVYLHTERASFGPRTRYEVHSQLNGQRKGAKETKDRRLIFVTLLFLVLCSLKAALDFHRRPLRPRLLGTDASEEHGKGLPIHTYFGALYELDLAAADKEN